MAVFNAANEEAVDAFHDGRIRFDQIVETVRDVVEDYDPAVVLLSAGQAPGELTVEAVLAAESWARETVRSRW